MEIVWSVCILFAWNYSAYLSKYSAYTENKPLLLVKPLQIVIVYTLCMYYIYSKGKQRFVQY